MAGSAESGQVAFGHRSRGAWFIALMLLGNSCGGPKMMIYGEEEVVETSRDDRPEWLERDVCPSGRACATGARTRGAAIEYARTDAQQDAIKDFGRRLASKTEAEFSAARNEGRLPEADESPDVDQAIKEIYTAVSQVNIEDVKVEDFWWRRTRAVGSDQRYHYYYDYNVLVSIPERIWREKVTKALNKQRDKLREAGHQKLVDEMDAVRERLLNREE